MGEDFDISDLGYNLDEEFFMSDEKFRSLLDESYQWPDYYEFKFIVKAEDKDKILALLIDFQISEKQSGKGNYISISARKLIQSTEEVVEIYQRMSSIKGVISL